MPPTRSTTGPTGPRCLITSCFKVQWEAFVRHVAEDAPHAYDFRSGVRGIRLAKAGLLSSAEGRRVELAALPE